MSMKSLFSIMVLSLVLLLLGGCGGGGGTASPTSGVLTLTAGGTLPAGTLISAIDVTISLPAGVTVKSVPDTTNPSLLVAAPGVVTVIGNAATVGATTLGVVPYTPATGTTPAQLRIPVLSVTGFNVGDFVTIACDIATGAPFPSVGSFGITVNSIVGSNGPSTTFPLTTGVTITASSFK